MSVVRLDKQEDVAVVTIDNAPMNVLNTIVRAGLIACMAKANADPEVVAVVLAARGRVFSAGADIKEFGRDTLLPSLPDVMDAFDRSTKPIVVAIHGTALGGSFELALACDARLATPNASLGLPEVKLGLIPGAQGTQRLPRLIKPAAALALIADGDARSASAALDLGILDDVIPEDTLLPRAIETARNLAAAGKRRVLSLIPAASEEDRASFEGEASKVLRKHADEPQIEAIVESVRATFDMAFAKGAALEREHFLRLRAGERSAAMRYAFFAERRSAHVDGMADATAGAVQTAAIIGGGTMGCGIAISLLNAGIATTIIEVDREAGARARDRIVQTYAVSVQRGSMSDEEKSSRLEQFRVAVGLEAVAEADLVVEAAFEDIGIKREIFSRLDRFAKPGAVLATNTSYLDVDEIAVATARPGDVVGMHFFSPANVMKLVEVVRGKATSTGTLKTVLAATKKIGKVPVTVGVCHGFVGNRMLGKRSEQVDRLLLEGALPQEIDAALRNFGFRMGPCEMSDLAGLDIGWRMRQATGKPAPAMDAVHDAGRLGQKNGRGYYTYPDGVRAGVPDPEVVALLVEVSAREGIVRRTIPEQEILDRLVFPMINEGARILEEGIAARPSDIDVIWLHGYNWPRWRGGPMYYADGYGLGTVAGVLDRLAAATGDPSLKPTKLLAELAKDGRGFGSMSDGAVARNAG